MDTKIEILDNFLPATEFEYIKKELLGRNFPWYLTKVVEPEHHDLSEEGAKYNFQVVHTMYINDAAQSKGMDLISPLITKLNPISILHIKANLTFRTPEVIEQGYHTDYPDEVSCTTGVFYVNTTDGYTKFLTGEVVESVENRLVLFDSRLKHTGTTCTDSDVRCVVNINIIPRA